MEILIQMGVWRGKDSLIKENTATVRVSISEFVIKKIVFFLRGYFFLLTPPSKWVSLLLQRGELSFHPLAI